MSNYNELTTVNDLRSQYMGVVGTTDDVLLLTFIRTASDWIHKVARRHFVPRIETRYFDNLRDTDGENLILDADLLSITTVTNGDAVAVASNERTTIPKNVTPYYAIRLLASSSKTWAYNSTTNDPEDAVSVLGVWGYHEDYANAWETLTTSNASMTNAATSITLLANAGNAGEIWKIESELVYVSSIANTTATVVRAVNGSAAVAHNTSTTIARWIPDIGIQHVAKLGAYGLLKLRDNPEGVNIVVDGVQFATLKDVHGFIKEQVKALNLVRQ